MHSNIWKKIIVRPADRLEGIIDLSILCLFCLLKIVWENKEGKPDGLPHLIYLSREKRPKHHHHYKAGAMNALVSHHRSRFLDLDLIHENGSFQS